jgi:hypothetical protein
VSILPAAFLVRYRLPLARFDRLPRAGKRLLDLPESARLAWPAQLDGGAIPLELRGGWNPHGLGFSLTVVNRTIPPIGNPADPARPDVFEIWLDTRDTQTVHRATRYCHHFAVFPTGGGDAGEAALTQALPVGRARDDAPLADADLFLTQCQNRAGGYTLDVWIPAEALTGLDVVQQPRIGFYCQLNDAEHGIVPFSVGDDFPATFDPSLWHTLELQDA